MSYQASVLADGPSAYWPMQDTSGTSLDEVVNNIDAALTGTYTLGVVGPLTENAVRFNNATGTAPDDAALDFVGDFTVEFWFRRSGVLSADEWPLVKSGPNPMWQIRMRGTDGELEFRMHDGTTLLGFQPWRTPRVNRNDGDWHLAHLTRDSDVRCYMDASLTATYGPPGHAMPGNLSNPEPLLIAKAFSQPFLADMAHLALYQYALTAGQIRNRLGQAQEGWGMLI